MEKIVDKINLVWAACTTLLAGIFGEFWFFFLAFFVLNIADYITGWLNAYLNHTECSEIGRRGIVKKVGYWVVIAIAFFIAISFSRLGGTIGADLSFMQLFGWFTLATFIINEIRSILENLVDMGVRVPGFLIKGLKMAADRVTDVTGGDEDADD